MAAERPFEFTQCSELLEILGVRAENERALADCIAEVPLDSIYYHTHGHLLRHGFVGAPYPNDFATWAAIQVRDRVLGERLAAVDPWDFDSQEELREELVSIIDDHLSGMQIIPRVIYGEPFEFMQSRIIRIPSGRVARSLREFRDGLAAVHPSAIYFHAVESRVRQRRQEWDPVAWVRESLRLPDLAARMVRIDPHLGGLERLRSAFLALCDEALRAEA